VPAWSAVFLGVGLLGLALALVVRRRRRLELGAPDPIATAVIEPSAARDVEVGAR
jgi:LPXTG-motif cell wall-anchored protein